MEEIAALIIELLKTHGRVSLPGLGAFVATPQAAVINKETKAVTPPSKKITFSKAETWNDGLLEQLYAERHDINLEEARNRLRHIIADIRFELDAVGKVVLPGLGTLKQSQLREIDFGLNKNLNLKADSYGLGEVKIEPSTNTFKVKREKNVSTPTATNHNLPLLILLGVIVVTISALLLIFFLKYRNNDDWMTPSAQEQEQKQPQPQPTKQHSSAAENEPVKTTPQRIVHTPAPAPAKAQPAAPKPQPTVSSSHCEYCVVATSLSTLQSAKLKADSYRQMGYKSEVINSGNNRYRVTLGCFRSKDEAEQEKREMQKFIADAWILEVCR